MARATRSLPVPLSPVISTVRSWPCRRWICSATRFIAALAQMKPGSSGSSGRSLICSAACGGRSRAPHSSNPWRATAANMRNRRVARVGEPLRGHDRARPRAVVVAAERLGEQQAVAVLAGALRRGARQRARDVGVAAGRGEDAHVAAGRGDEHDRRIGLDRFEQRRRGFAREQLGQDGGIHEPAHDGLVGVGDGDDRRGRGARRSASARTLATSSRSRSAPSVAKIEPA